MNEAATVTNGRVGDTQSSSCGYNTELKPRGRKPRDVLYDLMHFYDTQFKDIVAEVILRLKEEGASRGNAAEIAAMTKVFHEAAKMTIQCAEKLAPYEHSKLESIEVKKELTHRYVLRAPTPTVDISEWLEKAKSEQKLLEQKKALEHAMGKSLIDLPPPKKPSSPLIVEPDLDDDVGFPDELLDDDEDTDDDN